MITTLISHPDYAKHEPGPGHPERPQRVGAILERLAASGLDPVLAHLEPAPASRDLLEAIHGPAYLDRVAELARRGGGTLDPETVVSRSSYDVALLAAGGAVAAVEAVCARQAERAFAVIRPPGHHAGLDYGMGFCLMNNVAAAAHTALTRHGLSRVAIVDWDVHHGNGTQEIFSRRGDVLYISTHQENWYPGTGAVGETGAGAGEGYTVNIPLPASTGDEGYRLVFEEIVLPLLGAYRPQLVLISAGYDAHFGDPLGGMVVTAAGFRALAEVVGTLAARLDAKVAAVLEGGYDLTHLGHSVVATLEAFTGRSATGGEAPSAQGELPYRVIAAQMRQVRRVVRHYWNI